MILRASRQASDIMTPLKDQAKLKQKCKQTQLMH